MNSRCSESGSRTSVAVLTAIWLLGVAGCEKPAAPEAPAKNAAIPAPVSPAPAKNEKPEPNRADPVKAADSAEAAAVKAALAADSRLKTFAIDVRVANGTAELFGTVDSKSSQEKAEKVAAGVAGIKSVKNHLALVAGS